MEVEKRNLKTRLLIDVKVLKVTLVKNISYVLIRMFYFDIRSISDRI